MDLEAAASEVSGGAKAFAQEQPGAGSGVWPWSGGQALAALIFALGTGCQVLTDLAHAHLSTPGG